MNATELTVIEPSTPPTLFGTADAKGIIAAATEHATALADVIDQKNLYSVIEGKKYVRVEGWTLLGTMLGVFPVCTWTKRLEDGWEARVEARTLDDRLVGAAEAQCTRDETNWKTRKEYALRSMAQTRATAKALRLPLGFVMSLGGYEATPFEEMSEIANGHAEAHVVEGEVVKQEAAPRDEVLCKFCNGKVWDNRNDPRRTENSPHYRCRDKTCNAAAWIQEGGDLKWAKR